MIKKVELEINGRIIRVMPHLVDDMIKFYGASKTKKPVKDTPVELLKIPEKTIIPKKEDSPLPAMEIIKEPVKRVRKKK